VTDEFDRYTGTSKHLAEMLTLTRQDLMDLIAALQRATYTARRARSGLVSPGLVDRQAALMERFLRLHYKGFGTPGQQEQDL